VTRSQPTGAAISGGSGPVGPYVGDCLGLDDPAWGLERRGTARGVQVKEAELREKLLVVLPTLRNPTFRVIQGQFNDRLKRGLLDRTMRHMISDGLLQKATVRSTGQPVRRYQLTHDGLTERAHLMLSQRRRVS
jgi:hypothetical protein